MAAELKRITRMLHRFAIFLALPLLTACGFETVQGSGNLKTETRPVGKFTAIDLSGIGQLIVERAGTESLTVTADDNLLALFKSEVKSGTLYLFTESGKQPSRRAVYKVSVAELKKIDVSGAASIEATKLEGDRLSIDISGAATGNLAGRVDELKISVSGAGSFDAAALQAKRAEVSVSGAGKVIVNASDELHASVSGTGTILYIGSPKLTTEVSGVGSIKQLRQ
jgi:hypothetical protein